MKQLRVFDVALITYFNVCGGPWGVEQVVAPLGPFVGIISLVVFPILYCWFLPEDDDIIRLSCVCCDIGIPIFELEFLCICGAMLGCMGCSWRAMRTRIRHRQMVRIWCHLMRCLVLYNSLCASMRRGAIHWTDLNLSMPCGCIAAGFCLHNASVA